MDVRLTLTGKVLVMAFGLLFILPLHAALPCKDLNIQRCEHNTFGNRVAIAAENAMYGVMSSNVYANRQLPLTPDWQENRQLRYQNEPSGLDYWVYERRDGDEISEVAVAIRGTEDFSDWRSYKINWEFAVSEPLAMAGW